MTAQLSPPLHIVFTGGGTGGHLFPGLAVAESLQSHRPDVQITVAGTGPEWLGRRVGAAGYRYLHLPCRPVPGRLLGLFRFAVDNLSAYFAAHRFLVAHPAVAVVGLGGYASVPMAHAALSCRIPLILLEQNAVPGKASQLLSRRCGAVCLTFPQSRAALPARCPVYLTGNPVRRAFNQQAVRPPERPQLLVLGGSGGAEALNRCVPKVLGRLRTQLDRWRVVHQAGAHDAQATADEYAAAGLQATVVPWLDDMAATMRDSSLAISRAGGTTLAELAAAGLPAVLVPYPYAAAGHQLANARAFWAAGAAEVVQQHGGQVGFERSLRDALAYLLVQPARLGEMRAAMLRASRPDAADAVARLVLRHAGVAPVEASSRPSSREDRVLSGAASAPC